MKARYVAAAAVIVLMLSGCSEEDAAGGSGANLSAPITQIKAPNGDWTQVVEETAEGGVRMGNPAAPVKLVEYGSMTCGHCAQFSNEGAEPLEERYVKSGQVSYEFRPYMIFGTDPALTALVRCQGPAPFFQLVEQLYAGQGELIEKVQALPPAAQQQIAALPVAQQSAALIKAAGLDQFFRQRGVPQARIDACLADPQAAQRLLTVTNRAQQQEGVTGTPTFFVNGERVQAGTWADLEVALRGEMG